MRTVLRLAPFALAGVAGLWAALATGGCTVVTESNTTDSGVPADTSPVDNDTGMMDTGTTDTEMPETGTPAVIVKATDLIGSSLMDDVRNFGGGGTLADIRDNGKIAYAIAAYDSGSSKIESNFIGIDASGAYVDGRLTGLPTGSMVNIVVTGYLRGLNGNNADTPTTRIPWATAHCTATPSATADVVATCEKLALIPDLDGIVFSSDVLPPGYCAGKGATDFDLLRARTPYSGSAVVSKTSNDCGGVIWIPSSEFMSVESGGKSEWSLSLESKTMGTACTLAAPCQVDRMGNSVWIVGASCQLDDTTAPGGCF